MGAGLVRLQDRLSYRRRPLLAPADPLTPAYQELCNLIGPPRAAVNWVPIQPIGGAKKDIKRESACVLIRPDGYVGLADPEGDPVRLECYLETCGLRPLPISAGVAVGNPAVS